MTLTLHCVRVHDALSEDKRAKPRVRRYIVMASSAEEAMRKVANDKTIAAIYHDCRVTYRNDWEPNEAVMWDGYSDERKDYPHNAPTVADLKDN